MTNHKHYKIAYEAHRNISFSPEKRAESYCASFDDDIKILQEKGVDAAKIEKYEALWLKWMSAKSRCLSSMITGPANFPVRRAEKANNAEHKACQECLNYFNKLIAYKDKDAFYKKHPEARPIMSGDSDALERLKNKLETALKNQETMKAVNKAHRDYLKNPNSLEKSGLLDVQKETIRNYTPRYSWEPNPYQPFQLTNNNAEIKRLRDRIAEIENRKSSDAKEIVVNGVKIVENTEAMRLQVFFDGKPAPDIIALMKKNAFKWAPSAGAWQRQLTNNAVDSFNNFVLPELKRI